MLKIKDNVDLKELEKYGFNIFYDTYTGKPYAIAMIRGFPYADDIKRPFICFKKKKIIGFNKDKELNFFAKLNIPNNPCNRKEFFDILYDLIQEGFVEKV